MRITFIGGGNMANALIGGLLKQGFAAKDICVVEPLPDNRERLAGAFGIACLSAPEASALSCDVLVLAVKPQQMREALAPFAGRLSGQLVISIAAGVRLGDISRRLGGHQRLVRSMPNTPALIGAGITGLYADPAVDAQGRSQAERVLAAVGKTLWIADEAQMDAVTAVSGSGPAYVFFFIESLRDAARALGFPEDQARLLAIETVVGAAALAANSNEDVTLLRQRVTSKGGTTEAALNSLDADDFRAAILRAVQAANARGREMGELLGKD
ncbi:MAG: pyrroline-5-carboxylate reductase [Rhodocyclaceae bacterium]|jgi:pyrroline-5-carboxylate reductase|nr:Pyrroline-5-carboxylate reductase [Rhodocyclaceae bacterium]MBZ0143024.1 pyrroline-5-carboxylate reductase [Rhodocyclaceae bacterium]MCC6879095.1 pyrroline-5-carboxylate reductase [Rhodocyclaceae bacterium]MCL4680216.1 pyrroline-5-carboxylate reductase [Rhodocyclaceae bacterium]